MSSSVERSKSHAHLTLLPPWPGDRSARHDRIRRVLGHRRRFQPSKSGKRDDYSLHHCSIVIGLLVASLRLWRKSETLPAHSSPEESTYWRNSGKWFGLIFASEAALIAIASIVLGNTGHDALIPPVIALIVGLHFLLLAPLFRLPLYNVTGIAMSALALVCIIAVIAGWRPAGDSLFFWSISRRSGQRGAPLGDCHYALVEWEPATEYAMMHARQTQPTDR